jgi:hypothetical protein
MSRASTLRPAAFVAAAAIPLAAIVSLSLGAQGGGFQLAAEISPLRPDEAVRLARQTLRAVSTPTVSARPVILLRHVEAARSEAAPPASPAAPSSEAPAGTTPHATGLPEQVAKERLRPEPVTGEPRKARAGTSTGERAGAEKPAVPEATAAPSVEKPVERPVAPDHSKGLLEDAKRALGTRGAEKAPAKGDRPSEGPARSDRDRLYAHPGQPRRPPEKKGAPRGEGNQPRHDLPGMGPGSGGPKSLGERKPGPPSPH